MILKGFNQIFLHTPHGCRVLPFFSLSLLVDKYIIYNFTTVVLLQALLRMDKHTPMKKRMERVEEVMLEV